MGIDVLLHSFTLDPVECHVFQYYTITDLDTGLNADDEFLFDINTSLLTLQGDVSKITLIHNYKLELSIQNIYTGID